MKVIAIWINLVLPPVSADSNVIVGKVGLYSKTVASIRSTVNVDLETRRVITDTNRTVAVNISNIYVVGL